MQTKKRQRWTENEIKILKEKAKDLTVKEISKYINHPIPSIYGKAFKIGVRLRYKEKYAVPWNKGYGEYMKGEKNPSKREDVKLKISKALKGREMTWSSFKILEVQKKAQLAINRKPNGPEKKIIGILQKISPDFKYTGNGTFWIAHHNPDFVRKNPKQIIEHFGTHWHKESEVEELKKIYGRYGYETLIVWEPETKDEEKLRKIIWDFVEAC